MDNEHANGMALPRCIALLNAHEQGDDGTLELLFDDFEDALIAYARHGASATSVIPEIVRAPLRGASEEQALKAPNDIDAIVLGIDLRDADRLNGAFELLQGYLLATPSAPGTRLYAIYLEDDSVDNPAAHVQRTLSALCSEHNLSWHGDLTVHDSALIPAIMGSPRMGTARRWLSEAIDRLILAVRCGADAGELAAACPLPRFVRRHLAAKASKQRRIRH